MKYDVFRGKGPTVKITEGISQVSRGCLSIGEPHPAAWKALRYVRRKTPVEQAVLMEAFSSNAIEGNRVAEICAETLRRVMHGEPVSDRYILGLAWTLKEIDETLGNKQ